MNKEFIQVTKGVLPTSVLALLAIAFVAGQSQADMSIGQSEATIDLTSESIERQDYVRQSVESIPEVLDGLVTLPNDFNLAILVPRAAISAEILTNQKLADY